MEEGCCAEINGNHIFKNIKANIALGGQGSASSRIVYNTIEKSKQEGIFVVEGENTLEIKANVISNNFDGIVLLHSAGQVSRNMIE